MADIVDTTEKETKQFIVVRIGDEKFGIDIGYVDNIIRLQKITRVPKAQVWFKGIINLRGEIVPVMSARIKMGLEDDVFTNASRIIILKLEEKVDEIETPNVDAGKDLFINGIGKSGDELISLFELGAIIDEKDNN